MKLKIRKINLIVRFTTDFLKFQHFGTQFLLNIIVVLNFTN